MTVMVAREWDSADRHSAPNPSPATLIQEFARRGAAVPFTTPSLSHSRVRAGETGTLEVVVPALAGTKGVYIIPMKDLPLAVTMSVHDRVLHKLILERRATNPDLLRSVMLEVERQGLAGPIAATNAVQALDREAMDRLICAVYLIRIAFTKVESGGVALTLEELTSKAGQAQVRALLGTIAKETGGTADAYYTAIEQWGEVIAAVGVPEMEQPCRLRLVVRALLDLSSQILRWTKNDDSTDAERAVALSTFAKDVGIAAKQIVAKIDVYTQNFTDTLMRWSEAKQELTVLVDQLSWMLDGWDRHIERWRDAAQMSRPMQVTAIHAIADAYPERIKRTAPPAAAIKAAERTAKLARLSIGQDWRSGAANSAPKPRDSAIDGKSKLAEPTAAAQVDQLAEKQFDLSEDQLGKLVGVLEKARDSKDGDALGKDALDSIRPRMKVSQPYRPLTLERLFCVPFEDFLADGVAALRPGAILRTSIRPCWKFVEENLPKDLVADLAAKADAVATRDHQVLVDLGQQLWPAANAMLSTMIDRIEASGDGRQHALTKLGGERTLADFLLIGEALEVAASIMQLRGFLTPKPVLDLNAQRLAGVIQAFEDMNRPLRLPLLLRTLIGRVGDPGELLQALATVAIEEPRARQLAGAVKGEMVADLKDRIAALTDPATSPPPAALPAAVATLAEEAAERFQVIGAMPAGGDALAPLRARIVDTVRNAIVTPAETTVLLALSGPGEGGPRQCFEAMGQAEAHAHALRQCAGFAEALALGNEIAAKLAQLAKAVEEATERLLTPAPGAPASAIRDPAQRQAVLVHAVRMLEILSNPNRADQLRIRVERALG